MHICGMKHNSPAVMFFSESCYADHWPQSYTVVRYLGWLAPNLWVLRQHWYHRKYRTTGTL